MSIRERALQAIGWNFLRLGGEQFVALGFTAVLARLLTPEDYGVIGLMTIVLGAVALFAELGLGGALVQRENVDQEQLASIFWLNIVLSVVLSVLCAASSPWVAAFYGEPLLLELMPVASLVFLLSAPGGIQRSLLSRQMEFRSIAVIGIVSTVAGGLVGIGAASAGAGPWSLIWQSVVTASVMSLGLWFSSSWRPLLFFQWGAVRPFLKFGVTYTGVRMFQYGSRNLDNLLVGKFLGTEALGIYGRAYSLVTLPVSKIGQVVGGVMFSALARIQSDSPRVADAYLRGQRLVVLVTTPAVVGLGAIAEPLVGFLLGPQWAEVVSVLQLLCLATILQPVGITAGWLFLSQGRPDLQLKWQLFSGSSAMIAFCVGLREGIHGVAVAYGIVGVLLFIPQIFISSRLVDLTVVRVLRNVAPPIICSLTMGVAVLLLAAGLPAELHVSLKCLVLVAFGAGVFIAIAHTAKLQAYSELRALIKERLPARSG